MENQQKPWFKKWWGVCLIIVTLPISVPILVWTKTKWPTVAKVSITIVCVIIGIFAVISEDKPVEQAKISTEAPAQTQAESPKISPTKVEEKFDFTKAKLTEDNIKKALSEVLNENRIESITIENGNVDVFVKSGDVWDEKALIRNGCTTACEVYEILFTNPNVKKSWLWTSTKMVDSKGNETDENVFNVSMTKENAVDVNWPKFKDMVLIDYNSLLKIADSYFIHPSVKQSL